VLRLINVVDTFDGVTCLVGQVDDRLLTWPRGVLEIKFGGVGLWGIRPGHCISRGGGRIYGTCRDRGGGRALPKGRLRRRPIVYRGRNGGGHIRGRKLLHGSKTRKWVGQELERSGIL
jgi:hypothetical protein